MIKKYGTGIFAFIIAVAAVAFTPPQPKLAVATGPNSSYYFKFNGAHGNEATQSLWSELATVTDYNNEICASGATGCKLITTMVTGTAPNRRPANVYVDVNKTPIDKNEVSGVANKN